jgi:hypothetical protein
MDNKIICDALDGDRREGLSPVTFSAWKKLSCIIASAWVNLLKALTLFFPYIISYLPTVSNKVKYHIPLVDKYNILVA